MVQRWVFGMVNMDHSTKPIFYYVPQRDAATLLPIIQHHIPAGSTIVSDQWRAYAQLANMNYHHLTVNHSMNFVDPRTGMYNAVVSKNDGRLVKTTPCTYIFIQVLTLTTSKSVGDMQRGLCAQSNPEHH